MDIGEKSREKLRVFVKKQLLAIQQDMLSRLPENTDIDLPDIPEVLVNQALEVYIGTANRSLLDFFDEEGIYISIHCAAKDNFYFRWNEKFSKGDDIEHSNAVGKSSVTNFTSRRDCEIEAFTMALKILENKL